MADPCSIVTTSIVTQGLNCDLACGGGLIESKFHLYCIDPTVTFSTYIPGVIPLEPGQLKNLMQPVYLNKEEPYLVPVDKDLFFKQVKQVTVDIKLGKITNTAEYTVSTYQPEQEFVQVLNLNNATRENKKINIEGLRKFATTAKITIYDIRRINRKK